MIVVAHRGCFGKECTENTLEAFHSAIAAGADGIELDLRLSKDEEIVIAHDANLHRVAGDAHNVEELTATELAQIPLRHGGTIPTLQDVTTQIHSPALLDLELKNTDAAGPLALKLKTSASLRERSIVSSFSVTALVRIREEVPDVRTLLLVARWPLPLRGKKLWQKIRTLGPWGVAFPLSRLNPRRVATLRRFGFAAGGWDQRGRAAEAMRAKKLGLDLAIIRNISHFRNMK